MCTGRLEQILLVCVYIIRLGVVKVDVNNTNF